MQQNVCKEQIAIELEKHISSIYREIKRNADERNAVYKANLAIRKCKKRHKEKPKSQCFNIEIQNYVRVLTEADFSPEQIVGKSKKDGVSCVSHETIYKFVWNDKKEATYIST